MTGGPSHGLQPGSMRERLFYFRDEDLSAKRPDNGLSSGTSGHDEAWRGPENGVTSGGKWQKHYLAGPRMREDTDWWRPTIHHIIPVTSDSRVSSPGSRASAFR